MQVTNSEWTIKKQSLMRAYNNKENNPETNQPYTEEEYLQKFKEYQDKEQEVMRDALRDLNDRKEAIYEEVKKVKETPTEKVNMSKMYNDSIALYRDYRDGMKSCIPLKKAVRDVMDMRRKQRKKENV